MATDFLTSLPGAALAASASLLLTPAQDQRPAVDPATAPSSSRAAAPTPSAPSGPREVVISYPSHTDALRKAYVRYPTWYGAVVGRRCPS